MTAAVKKSDKAENDSSVTAQIDTLRDELNGLTRTVTDFGKAKSDEVIASAKATASEARDTLADQAETARLRAMVLQDDTTNFIRTQPVAALGIAAGVGLLVDLALARQSDRR